MCSCNVRICDPPPGASQGAHVAVPRRECGSLTLYAWHVHAAGALESQPQAVAALCSCCLLVSLSRSSAAGVEAAQWQHLVRGLLQRCHACRRAAEPDQSLHQVGWTIRGCCSVDTAGCPYSMQLVLARRNRHPAVAVPTLAEPLSDIPPSCRRRQAAGGLSLHAPVGRQGRRDAPEGMLHEGLRSEAVRQR